MTDTDLWTDEPFEPCGAEFPLRPGQKPCSKPKGHEGDPDTNWKRHEHSNGLLKWRVDGADMPGDIPTKAAELAILRAAGITGSQRHEFAKRVQADPLGFCNALAAEVVAAIRHADRVIAGSGGAS